MLNRAANHWISYLSLWQVPPERLWLSAGLDGLSEYTHRCDDALLVRSEPKAEPSQSVVRPQPYLVSLRSCEDRSSDRFEAFINQYGLLTKMRLES